MPSMNQRILLTYYLLFLCTLVFAQEPTSDCQTPPFQKRIEIQGKEVQDALLTNNGENFYTAYRTKPFADRLLGVTKLTKDGSVVWSKSYEIGLTSNPTIRPRSLITTSNGDLVILVTDPGFNERGGILRLDSSGNILWFKEYYDLNVSRVNVVIENDQGNLVTAGWARSNSQEGWITLSELTPNGDFIWKKRFSFFADNDLPENGRVEFLLPSPSDGYIVGGYTNISALNTWIVKTDSTGEPEWGKKYFDLPNFQNTITKRDNGYYWVQRLTDLSNFSDIAIHKLDEYGNILDAIKISGTEYFFPGDIVTLPDGGISLSFQSNFSDFSLLNFSDELELTYQQSFNNTGRLANIFGNLQQILDGSIYLAAIEDNQYLNFIKTDFELNASCPSEVLNFTIEEITGSHQDLNFMVEPSEMVVSDGSIIPYNEIAISSLVCGSETNPFIYLDTLNLCTGTTFELFGNIITEPGTYDKMLTSVNGCDSIHRVTVNYADNYDTQEAISLYEGQSALVNGDIVSTAGTHATTFTNQAGCDSTHTVTVNVYTQDCEIDLYNKTITSPGRLINPHQIVNYNQSLFLSFFNGIDRFGITKTDLDGNAAWIKRYRPDSRYRLSDMLATQNGGFIHMGAGNDNLKIIYFDSEGNIIWSKGYELGNEVNSGKILQLENSDFIVMISSDATGFNHSCVLMRIDIDGNIIWKNDLGSDVAPDDKLFIPANLTIAPDGGYLITGRELSLMTNMKVDENGNTVWLKRYDLITGLGYSTIIKEDNTGYYIFQYSFFGSNNNIVIMEIDLQGNVIRSKLIESEVFSGGGQIAALPFGRILLSGKLENSISSDALILLDTEFNIINRKTVGATVLNTTFFPINKNFVTIGEEIYLSDNSRLEDEDGFYLQKLSANLEVACQGESFPVTLVDRPVQVEDIPFFNRDVDITIQDFTIQITDYEIEEEILCEATISTGAIYGFDVLEFCAGDPANVNGTIFTSDTILINTYQIGGACDSTHTTTVNFQTPQFTFEDIQVCDENSTVVNGQTIFSDTTLYTFSQTSIGCDSTHQINVIFGTNKFTDEYQQYCQGTTINIFGNPISFSGTYTETYTGFDGCDSTHSILAEFKNNLLTVDLQDYCEGETAMVNGMTYLTDTILFENTTSFYGCDSTHRTTLRFLENVEIEEEISACVGETVPVFGLSISRDTFLTRTALAPNGCDSIWSVSVSFLENIQTNEIINACDGEMVMVFGNPVFQDTIETQIFTRNNNCDSTHTISVIFNPIINTSETVIACEGDTLMIFGNEVTQDGSFSEIFTSSFNCDSTHQIEVIFNNTINTAETQTYCDGMSANIFGIEITSDTILFQTSTGFNNCDSIHQIEAVFFENINTSETLASCLGETVIIFGNPITENGIFSETYTAVNGCDSTHQVTISFSNTVETNETIMACEGEIISVFGNEVLQDTTESQTFISNSGCDSTHTISVIFNSIINTSETVIACEGDTVMIFGNEVTQDGSFSEIFTSSFNCDSTHQIEVIFNNIINTAETQTYCDGTTANIFGIEITSDTILFQTSTGFNNCDSIHQIEAVFFENINTSETLVSCLGETVIIFGNPITENGTFSETYTAINSCDSTHQVTISFSNTIETNETITACEGEIISVFGNEILQDTIDSQTYFSNSGCDSTHTISVVFNSIINTSETLEACAGETLVVFGNPVSENGIFNQTFTSILNCDSTHQIEVVFNNIINTFETQTYCAGDIIEIDGLEISTDQDISFMETAMNGCDSTHLLSIQFVEENLITETAHLCPDEFVVFFEDTIRLAGNYTSFMPASNGQCDTIYELDVTVSDQFEWSLADTIFTTNGINLTLPLQIENNEWTISWNDSEQLSCLDCIQPIIDPQYDELLEFTISNSEGCTVTGQVFLEVEQAVAYYIPNAFSPNEDQINDRFFVSGNSKVQAIKKIEIFNRWGAIVYQDLNLPLNDSDRGWDGNFKGQRISSGVYVYMIELILADGTIVLASGDITLVR